jgi:arylsulfatase A-like enzyme
MQGTTTNGSRNDPLRGSKRTTLEGGIRVPFLVALPGKIKPSVYDQPAIQLDLTATALTLGGAKTDKVEGVDLLPFLAGEKTGAPHDALYWRFGQQMAIRAGDYKLVQYDPNVETATGKQKKQPKGAKLYNLTKDIGEANDLAEAMPDKVKELQGKWDAWNQSNVPPLWGDGNVNNDGPEPSGQKKRKKKPTDE